MAGMLASDALSIADSPVLVSAVDVLREQGMTDTANEAGHGEGGGRAGKGEEGRGRGGQQEGRGRQRRSVRSRDGMEVEGAVGSCDEE